MDRELAYDNLLDAAKNLLGSGNVALNTISVNRYSFERLQVAVNRILEEFPNPTVEQLSGGALVLGDFADTAHDDRLSDVPPSKRDIKAILAAHFKATIPEDATIYIAAYTYRDYSGKAFVLFSRDGKLYEVNGHHCSCYGLEEQWKPEEVNLAELHARPEIFGYGWNEEEKEIENEIRAFLSEKLTITEDAGLLVPDGGGVWEAEARRYASNEAFWRARCKERCARDGHVWVDTEDQSYLYCTCCGATNDDRSLLTRQEVPE